MSVLLDGLLDQVAAFTELVLPTSCAGCGTRGAEREVRAGLCPPCRVLLSRPARLAWPSPTPPGLPPPWTVAGYQEAVRSVILAYKESGRTALTRPLARALATAVTAALVDLGHHPTRAPPGSLRVPPCLPATEALLVPVPVRRFGARGRGFDPVGRLAVLASRTLRARGVPARPLWLLDHVRPGADQSRLDARERAVNMAGALAVRRSPPTRMRGSPVVLVDDVLTTGATLAEAARALRSASVDVGAAAAVAATRRRG